MIGVIIDIKSLIKDKWITFKKLSIITGISTQQLSNINRQKTDKVSFNTVAKLLTGLQCSPNDLFVVEKNGKEKA